MAVTGGGGEKRRVAGVGIQDGSSQGPDWEGR